MTPASGLLIYCDIKDMGPDMVSYLNMDFSLAHNVCVLSLHENWKIDFMWWQATSWYRGILRILDRHISKL
jgi:hypothetical protein